MVEAIKIRKMGYEFREHLEGFIDKYWVLVRKDFEKADESIESG